MSISGATPFTGTAVTSNLNVTTLQTALAASNVVVDTNSGFGSPGNITVQNAVAWASGNSLTLTANNSIAINAAVTTGAAASRLILNAGGAVTQTAVIGGLGGLTKNGLGTLILSNSANTYGGGTFVNGGTLTLARSAKGTTFALELPLLLSVLTQGELRHLGRRAMTL